MSDAIDRYLSELDRRLRGRPNRRRLREEAEDHLRASQADLQASGVEEAAEQAVARMGGPASLATAGGGRAPALTVLALGVLGTVGLLVGAALTTPSFQDAPSPALPLHLLAGGLAAAVITACASWTAWTWGKARATSGPAVRGAILTAGATVAAGFGELAIHFAKERLFTPYCLRIPVHHPNRPDTHNLICTPAGSRDYATAELHGLLCLAAGGAVLALTFAAMRWHARRERRSAGRGAPTGRASAPPSR